MKSETETIKSTGGFLRVELEQVLSCINEGKDYHWAILYLEAMGNLGGKSIVDFENEIHGSSVGYLLNWDELVELANKFDQVIDIVLIGDSNKSKLRQYAGEEEMFKECYYTIELIDSSYWLINGRDRNFLDRLQKELGGVYVDFKDWIAQKG
jgi:hypothetical protein